MLFLSLLFTFLRPKELDNCLLTQECMSNVLKIVIQSQKVMTRFYSNLLYEMGYYFLDTQYSQMFKMCLLNMDPQELSWDKKVQIFQGRTVLTGLWRYVINQSFWVCWTEVPCLNFDLNTKST